MPCVIPSSSIVCGELVKTARAVMASSLPPFISTACDLRFASPSCLYLFAAPSCLLASDGGGFPSVRCRQFALPRPALLPALLVSWGGAR